MTKPKTVRAKVSWDLFHAVKEEREARKLRDNEDISHGHNVKMLTEKHAAAEGHLDRILARFERVSLQEEDSD